MGKFCITAAANTAKSQQINTQNRSQIKYVDKKIQLYEICTQNKYKKYSNVQKCNLVENLWMDINESLNECSWKLINLTFLTIIIE